LAIQHNHSALAQLLLDNGATALVNSVAPVVCCNGAQCCTHTIPLILCDTADTVKVLLAAGADVHLTNNVGDTCLHSAARHNYKAPVLCLLIKAGADITAVNSEGKTAAQIAHDRGYTLIEQLLNRAAQQGY
jgi:ankyrin repeat protein